MNSSRLIVLVATTTLLVLGLGWGIPQDKETKQEKSLTYVKDIAPIVDKYCISCHGSDNENPSDLYMDDFATMMKGGKHGVPVVPGKPEESNLYLKLTPNPPFGKQMPRGHKKITPEAVQIIHDWIAQGAKEK